MQRVSKTACPCFGRTPVCPQSIPKTSVQRLTQAANTPVPDSPIPSIHENSSGHDGQVTETGQESESTESLGTDQESQDPNMEPVYNVSIFENGYHSDVFVEDLNTVWPEQDDLECLGNSCLSSSRSPICFFRVWQWHPRSLGMKSNIVNLPRGKRNVSASQTKEAQMLVRHKHGTGHS